MHILTNMHRTPKESNK